MSFLKGKDGVVRYGAAKDLIGHIQSWNMDTTSDEVTGWGMGDEFSSTFATVKSWSGSMEFYLDFSDPGAAITVGDEFALDLYPGGEDTGSGYYSGNVAVTGVARSGEKAGIPSVTVNFRGIGALNEGVAP